MSSTLKDVARLAGVSVTTASHAMNGKPVNENTRTRVLEAAKKLKYHASVIGRNLITNRSHTIGMFIINSSKETDMTEEISYYYAMLKGALHSVQKHGYVFNFEVVEWEDIYDGNFIEKKVYGRTIDGMILVPQFMYHYSFINLLNEEKFPYVIVNPSTNIKPENTIKIDNRKGGYMAADHLLSLGHRKIAIINGPEKHKDSFDRENGFITRLLESGIKYDRKSIIYSDFTNEGGYMSAKKILQSSEERPTAMFCANDYMASGAVAAIREIGLEIPRDISVMGYDDTDIARCIYPRLSTMRVAVRELGYLAAERVLDLVGLKDADGVMPALEEIVLVPQLIERSSTSQV